MTRRTAAKPGPGPAGEGTMPAEQALAALLTQGRRWAPEYADGLSNHRPMALLALHRLGADAARLQAWAAACDTRLQPAPAPEPWPRGDGWPGRLGDVSAWPAYRSLFAEWLQHEGATDVLGQVLPGLMTGCGAAAFHGPIRLAAAVRSGHHGEVADALAYWASRHQPLGLAGAGPADALPPGDGPEPDPEALLRRLAAGRSRQPLIVQRMVAAARDDGFHRTLALLQVDERTLPRLARLSAQAYACSGNFTALHLVTACHAARVLLRFIDDAAALQRALCAFWQAWAAAVVAAQLQPLPWPAARPWPELVAAALAQDDEHVIKLVEACREEDKAWGGDDWQRAASRALMTPGRAR